MRKPSLILLLLPLTLAAEEADEVEIEYPEPPADDGTVSSTGEETGALIPELELSAYIEADLRHRTEPPETFTYNENDIGLKLRTVWDVADAEASLRLRGTGFTSAGELAELTRRGVLDPWELELNTAYVNLYGVPLAPLDISFGRREIGWGVGDELRVFNEVNPGDYRDPLSFGDKLGVETLMLTAWFSPTWRLEGVFVPTFTPARLPADLSLITPEIELEEGLWLSELNMNVATPEQSLAQAAQYGARLKGGLGPVDLELAYHYGRDYLPVPTDVTLTPTIDPEAPEWTLPVIVDVTGSFPRRHLVGASFAADVADIGLWGEVAAYIYPEEITQIIHTILGDTSEPLYPAKPYFKWLGGIDYSLGGWYAQLQYLHGFYSERGAHEQSDLFMLALEKGLFYEKLILRVAGAYEIPDFDTVDEHWGLAVIPEIEYKPLEQISLTLGGRWLEGDGVSNLTLLEHEDVVYLKLRVDL
ncbi:MAG: hypothetical protein GF399_12615 [Candidatus Coatesbacteria bacterium]|nr:hypothetical protein [Candidatus Coatesbacteria bacterium]